MKAEELHNRYARVRKDHASETAEDYLELIDDLRRECGEARAVDIARAMQVSHATATKVLARLEREGLIVSRPYRGVTPTDEGLGVAARARKRHQMVLDFLLAIGVPPEVAEEDAEGIEHHVSQATLATMAAFLAAQP